MAGDGEAIFFVKVAGTTVRGAQFKKTAAGGVCPQARKGVVEERLGNPATAVAVGHRQSEISASSATVRPMM